MKTAIVCAIAAAALGVGSVSFAQGYDGRPDAQRQAEQQYGHGAREWRREAPQPQRFEHARQLEARQQQFERNDRGYQQRVRHEAWREARSHPSSGQPGYSQAYDGGAQPVFVQQAYEQPGYYGASAGLTSEAAIGAIAGALIGQLLANR